MYNTIEELLKDNINLEKYNVDKSCAVFATDCSEFEGCKKEWTIGDIAEEAKRLGYGVHFTECSWNGSEDYLIVSPVVSIEDAIISQYWTREDMFPRDLRSLVNWDEVRHITECLMDEDDYDDYDDMHYELDMMYFEDYEDDLSEDEEC